MQQKKNNDNNKSQLRTRFCTVHCTMYNVHCTMRHFVPETYFPCPPYALHGILAWVMSIRSSCFLFLFFLDSTYTFSLCIGDTLRHTLIYIYLNTHTKTYKMFESIARRARSVLLYMSASLKWSHNFYQLHCTAKSHFISHENNFRDCAREGSDIKKLKKKKKNKTWRRKKNFFLSSLKSFSSFFSSFLFSFLFIVYISYYVMNAVQCVCDDQALMFVYIHSSIYVMWYLVVVDDDDEIATLKSRRFVPLLWCSQPPMSRIGIRYLKSIYNHRGRVRNRGTYMYT